MNKALLSIVVLFFSFSLVAQTDDCPALDLGTAPFCDNLQFFNNITATTTDIGNDNIPDCFDNASVDRDVWVSFTATSDFLDYTIQLLGVSDGTNMPIVSPQIAIYRGECMFDGLALLACASASDGSSDLSLDVFGLDPGETYFLRINDYNLPGSFNLCITEYIPFVNMGDIAETTSCNGTLFDSGGQAEDYSNDEDLSFKICPSQNNSCIQLEVVEYAIEDNFDQLNVYAGENNGAPLIATLTGVSTSSYNILASSDCVFLEFTSDGSVADVGFEIRWQCLASACPGSTFDNPTVINGLPVDLPGESTCGDGATFSGSACGEDFTNGPESIYAYDSPGNECIAATVTNAAGGTGILILDGPADDPNSNCIAFAPNGNLTGATLENPGTYYFIVANATGCTDFDLNIFYADCLLLPSLENALCNPLNGCVEVSGLPSVFTFQQGFQDIEFNEGVNDGCWVNAGSVSPNYYWFTIQAQADGNFGFIVQADDPAEASDIDFSVWGPFTEDQACDDPMSVITLVNTTQPIRSSWAGGADPTGLALFNADGDPVTDEYDCDPIPSAGGDDFASVIQAQEGEIYAVLINDWGDDIQSGAISVDWSDSDTDVLGPITADIIFGDTTICAGTSAQLLVDAEVDSILWFGPNTADLSCISCFDPMVTTTQTTTYEAVVVSVCNLDTVAITVSVYELNDIPDYTVCIGEEIELVAGEDYSDGTYEWAGPDLSCTDCPDPILTTVANGVFNYTVTLTTPGCVLTQTFTVEVGNEPAPNYVIADDQTVCEGTTVPLGGFPTIGVDYSWTTELGGVPFSTMPNPEVSPTNTTTYYLEISNGICPFSSFDSVEIVVVGPPVFELGPDISVCVGDTVQFLPVNEEAGTDYTWNTSTGIVEPGNPNTPVVAINTFEFILTAENEACIVEDTVQVTAQNVAINIVQDDTALCRGDSVSLNVVTTPATLPVNWSPTTGLNFSTGNNNVAKPEIETTYVVTTSLPGCVQTDSITIDVDSLPQNLDIMPLDTLVCRGALVILSSTAYSQARFPEIQFQWTPNLGFESTDTLLNIVIEAQETTTYERLTTNGVCTQVDTALLEVVVPPEIMIMPEDPEICEGGSVDLLATAPGVTEWEWTPADNLSCTECQDPTASPPSSTTYNVMGEFMNCPVSASVGVIVRSDPTYAFPMGNRICPGESIVLNQEVDTNPNTTYSWTSLPPGFTSMDAQPTVSPLVNTTYLLTIDNGVCPPLMDQYALEILPLPELVLDQESFSLCAGDNAMLSASSNISGTFTWSPNLGEDIGTTISSISFNPNDTILVSVEFSAQCGTLSESVLLNVTEQLSGTIALAADSSDLSIIGVDTTIFEGDVLNLVFLPDEPLPPGTSIEWFDGEGNPIGTGPFASITASTDPTEIFVGLTRPDGCFSEIMDDFPIQEAMVEMPNIFTPNDDGRNDVFRPFTSGEYLVNRFQIWNRRGQVVYDSMDFPNATEIGWDGRSSDKAQPADVYMYIIELESPSGRVETMKGEVVLVR